MFPICLPRRGLSTTAQAIEAAKTELRRMPQRGIGYGVLRYLAEAAVAQRLENLPQAEISFNYLGQLDSAAGRSEKSPAPETTAFRLVSLTGDDWSGACRHPGGLRSHFLEVNSYVVEGCLTIEWTYSDTVHRRETVERLAQSYLDSLNAVLGVTPDSGDGLPLIAQELGHSQQPVAGHTDRSGNSIEALYTLAPMQQVMLDHIRQGSGRRAYMLQWHCLLQGPLNVSALQQAWQTAIDRHPALRTTFAWDQTGARQLVHQRADLLWSQLDWRQQSMVEQEFKLADYLAADRARGFDLSEAPLMRMTLIRLTENSYRLVWSHHHLLLDGWSTGPLWREITAYYEAIRQDQVLPPAPPESPYQAYLAWLQQQDRTQATDFWWEQFWTWPDEVGLGLSSGRGSNQAADTSYREEYIWLSREATAELQNLAQHHRLTLSSVIQGAWAALLSQQVGRDVVTFGTVVANRPVEVASAGDMVGLFVNLLPVQVQVPPEARLWPWLADLQQHLAELRHWGDALAPVAVWGELHPNQPLFDTVLRFQNYPTGVARSLGDTVHISDVRWLDEWPYPLNVEIIPGEALFLKASYDEGSFDREAVADVLTRFERLLQSLAADPELRLADLLARLEASEAPLTI